MKNVKKINSEKYSSLVRGGVVASSVDLSMRRNIIIEPSELDKLEGQFLEDYSMKLCRRMERESNEEYEYLKMVTDMDAALSSGLLYCFFESVKSRLHLHLKNL